MGWGGDARTETGRRDGGGSVSGPRTRGRGGSASGSWEIWSELRPDLARLERLNKRAVTAKL